MDYYGFLLNLKLYFVKYKYGVFFNGKYNKEQKKSVQCGKYFYVNRN